MTDIYGFLLLRFFHRHNKAISDVLKSALLGETILFSEDPWKQFTKDGVLLNSDDGEDVPKLCLLFLKAWAERSETDLTTPIHTLLQYGDQGGGEGFERFHTQWEVVVRRLHEGNTVSVLELYHIERSRVCFFVDALGLRGTDPSR